MKKKSSFDTVKNHMLTCGAEVPVSAEVRDDLEMVVRRAERVRGLSSEYEVELSPYMQSLLRVSSAVGINVEAARTPVAASV